jgi:hypothetical protein
MNELNQTDDRPWTAGLPPRKPGIHEWRVPHRRHPDLHVVFLARMRLRGAGHESVHSPEFDHWDGWSVHVPAHVEWRVPADPSLLPKDRYYTQLRVEELTPEPCPFCGRTPTLHGCQTGGGSGIVIGAKPFDYDSWNLTCCAWATSPRMSDVRKLIETRAAMLAAHRGSHDQVG